MEGVKDLPPHLLAFPVEWKDISRKIVQRMIDIKDKKEPQVCALDVGKENIGKMSANLSSEKMEPLLARKKKEKRQKTDRGAIS